MGKISSICPGCPEHSSPTCPQVGQTVFLSLGETPRAGSYRPLSLASLVDLLYTFGLSI